MGEGERLGAGEWLGEESLSAAARRRGGGMEKKETRENDGWIGRGSSHSRYAPKPAGAASAAAPPAPLPAATPLLQSNGFATSSSASSAPRSTSLLDRFTSPGEDEQQRRREPAPAAPAAPFPNSPKTPARNRPPQLDLNSTPVHMRPFSLPLVSPSTTRTPLSATAPLPETPLKHGTNLPSTNAPNAAAPAVASSASGSTARQALSERRHRPHVPPISPAAHEEATRGLGLGLGLTPTRPTAFAAGGPLSPVNTRRVELPTIPASEAGRDDTDEEGEGEATYKAGEGLGGASHETVGVGAGGRDEAVDQIESMLLRLRTAKTGLKTAGSSASRWATPPAQKAALLPAESEPAAPRSRAAAHQPDPESEDEGESTPVVAKVSGDDQQKGWDLLSRLGPAAPSSSTSEAILSPPLLDLNGQPTSSAAGGKEVKPTTKREKQGRKASGKGSGLNPPAAPESLPPPTPRLDGDEGAFGGKLIEKDVASSPPLPTAPRAMRQKDEDPEPAAAQPAKEERMKAEEVETPKAEEPSASAPLQPAAPPSSPPRDRAEEPVTATTPAPAPASSSPPPSTPTIPQSPTAHGSLASPLSPSTSFSSSQHFDWAADEDDDEDALPDLTDWGVELPTSGSAPSISTTGPSSEVNEETKPAQSVQRELLPAKHAPTKGGRGGGKTGGGVSNGASTSAASNPAYAAWRRGDRASSVPLSSSSQKAPTRELFPSTTSSATSPHPSQLQASRADGDWKAARVATLAAEEKREPKNGKVKTARATPSSVAANAAIAAATTQGGGVKKKASKKTLKGGATEEAAPPTPAIPSSTTSASQPQGMRIAGVANSGRSVSSAASSASKQHGPSAPAARASVVTPASPPKGPRADRDKSKVAVGGSGGAKKGSRK